MLRWTDVDFDAKTLSIVNNRVMAGGTSVPAVRHTCATLMHLQGVPIAVIAAWIGHKDASLAMRLNAHSRDEALKATGATLNRGVTFGDNELSRSKNTNNV